MKKNIKTSVEAKDASSFIGRDDLSTVLGLTNKQELNKWVQNFLRIEGSGNIKLANRLLEYEDFVVGPIEFPLHDMVSILGPDDSYIYYEDPAILNHRVKAMGKSIEHGWKPAPIISTNIWKDYLEIADGCHRQRALLAAGFDKYHTIFYFRNAESMNIFLKTHGGEVSHN